MFETDICIYLKWLHFVHTIIVTGGVRVVIAKIMLCIHVSNGKCNVSSAIIVKGFEVEHTASCLPPDSGTMTST